MEFNKQTSTARSSASEAIIDQGLRAYMLKVYNYMASGVLLTGVVALLFFKMAVVSDGGQIIGLTNFGNTIYASGLKWVIMLAPLAVVFYMSFGIAKMSASKAQTVFWIFAAKGHPKGVKTGSKTDPKSKTKTMIKKEALEDRLGVVLGSSWADLGTHLG